MKAKKLMALMLLAKGGGETEKQIYRFTKGSRCGGRRLIRRYRDSYIF